MGIIFQLFHGKLDGAVSASRCRKYGVKPPQGLVQIGHAIGGVCPFGVPESVTVYLYESLRRFDTVFPAAGSANSAIELSMEELEKYSHAKEWIDVCKGWQEA